MTGLDPPTSLSHSVCVCVSVGLSHDVITHMSGTIWFVVYRIILRRWLGLWWSQGCLLKKKKKKMIWVLVIY